MLLLGFEFLTQQSYGEKLAWLAGAYSFVLVSQLKNPPKGKIYESYCFAAWLMTSCDQDRPNVLNIMKNAVVTHLDSNYSEQLRSMNYQNPQEYMTERFSEYEKYVHVAPPVVSDLARAYLMHVYGQRPDDSQIEVTLSTVAAIWKGLEDFRRKAIVIW